jgi:hypothetical protein
VRERSGDAELTIVSGHERAAACRRCGGHVEKVHAPGERRGRIVLGQLAGAREHAVPVERQRHEPLLPLYEAGYTSIGCEPCTTVPFDPENPRSGRWQGEKLECGIHIQAK